METEYDYLFKIVLIGDSGVGKASIVRCYTEEIFKSAGIPTIGVDFCIKTLQIGSSTVKVCACVRACVRTCVCACMCVCTLLGSDSVVNFQHFLLIPFLSSFAIYPPPLPLSPQLQIWDTAGQERFRTVTQSYYRSADAIILVYDIGLPVIFRNLPEWLSEVERYAKSNVQKFLIGNKSDDWPDRKISIELGRKFSQENDMPFLEVSTINS